MSGDVYDITSPPEIAWHVWLRKIYSIGAFALVGGCYAFARRRVTLMDAALLVALYSGLIEIGQWFVGDEPLGWNLFDVGCGFVGGALGALVFNRWRAGRAR